jgi:hypothetical protein
MMILVNLPIDLNKVSTKSFILGTIERLLKGLNSLKVLKILEPPIVMKEKFCISPVMTTIMSSQFHGSYK